MTGTWWLLPCYVLAGYNLFFLYKLGAPYSVGARMSRTFGMMACLLAIFQPLEPFIGIDWLSEASFIMLLLSFATQNTQYHFEEKRKPRRRKHFVEAFVQPPNSEEHHNGVG